MCASASFASQRSRLIRARAPKPGISRSSLRVPRRSTARSSARYSLFTFALVARRETSFGDSHRVRRRRRAVGRQAGPDVEAEDTVRVRDAEARQIPGAAVLELPVGRRAGRAVVPTRAMTGERVEARVRRVRRDGRVVTADGIRFAQKVEAVTLTRHVVPAGLETIRRDAR